MNILVSSFIVVFFINVNTASNSNQESKTYLEHINKRKINENMIPEDNIIISLDGLHISQDENTIKYSSNPRDQLNIHASSEKYVVLNDDVEGIAPGNIYLENMNVVKKHTGAISKCTKAKNSSISYNKDYFLPSFVVKEALGFVGDSYETESLTEVANDYPTNEESNISETNEVLDGLYPTTNIDYRYDLYGDLNKEVFDTDPYQSTFPGTYNVTSDISNYGDFIQNKEKQPDLYCKTPIISDSGNPKMHMSVIDDNENWRAESGSLYEPQATRNMKETGFVAYNWTPFHDRQKHHSESRSQLGQHKRYENTSTTHMPTMRNWRAAKNETCSSEGRGFVLQNDFHVENNESRYTYQPDEFPIRRKLSSIKKILYGRTAKNQYSLNFQDIKTQQVDEVIYNVTKILNKLKKDSRLEEIPQMAEYLEECRKMERRYKRIEGYVSRRYQSREVLTSDIERLRTHCGTLSNTIESLFSNYCRDFDLIINRCKKNIGKIKVFTERLKSFNFRCYDSDYLGYDDIDLSSMRKTSIFESEY